MSSLTKAERADMAQRAEMLYQRFLRKGAVSPDAYYSLEIWYIAHVKALIAHIEALEAVVEAGRQFLEASTNHVDRLVLIQKGDAFHAALQRLQEGKG